MKEVQKIQNGKDLTLLNGKEKKVGDL